MLRDDGDFLLVFLASCPVFDIFKELSNQPDYTGYMKDVDKYIAPFHYSENPGADYSNLMASVGLLDYHVEIRDLEFVYENVDVLKSK